MRTIYDIKMLSVTTAAQDVELCGRMFAVQNQSDAETVYFREKDRDGVACTAANGIAVAPGATVDLYLCGGYTLSVIGSGSCAAAVVVFE